MHISHMRTHAAEGAAPERWAGAELEQPPVEPEAASRADS